MKLVEIQEPKKRFKVQFKTRTTSRESELTLDRMRKLAAFTHSDMLRVERLLVGAILQIQHIRDDEKTKIDVTRLA